MNVPGDGSTSATSSSESGADAQRRAKLRKLADDPLLPALTSDELPDPAESAADADAWYNENRPPHHDR